MKVFNNLLNLLNLNDESDYDEYDEYDDYEDYEEEIAEHSFRKSRQKQKEKEAEEKPVKQAPQKPVSKVTPMRQRKSGGAAGMELRVIKPTSFEDATDITDTLISNRAVVLNLEGIDMELAHRIMDFTYGSCYAMNGNLRKVSNYILVITPETMDISGDFQELFANAAAGGSFDDDF